MSDAPSDTPPPTDADPAKAPSGGGRNAPGKGARLDSAVGNGAGRATRPVEERYHTAPGADAASAGPAGSRANIPVKGQDGAEAKAWDDDPHGQDGATVPTPGAGGPDRAGARGRGDAPGPARD